MSCSLTDVRASGLPVRALGVVEIQILNASMWSRSSSAQLVISG